MTRIRYIENRGILVSPWFLAGRDVIRITVNLVNMQYVIWFEGNKTGVSSPVKNPNRVKLMKAAKQHAINLGLVCWDEVRKKK